MPQYRNERYVFELTYPEGMTGAAFAQPKEGVPMRAGPKTSLLSTFGIFLAALLIAACGEGDRCSVGQVMSPGDRCSFEGGTFTVYQGPPSGTRGVGAVELDAGSPADEWSSGTLLQHVIIEGGERRSFIAIEDSAHLEGKRFAASRIAGMMQWRVERTSP